MEAAGLMNIIPYIVIRGICDYADSKKNKDWQEYAASVAVASAKELLEYVDLSDVNEERPVNEIVGAVMTTVDRMDTSLKVLRYKSNKDEDLKIPTWLTDIDYGPQHSDFLKGRQPGTGQWFLNSDGFLLARLHLNSLICMRSPKAIQNALKKPPQVLNAYDSAYDRAMERINGRVPSARELAEQTITWITCAKRQLVPELLHALAVEIGQPDLTKRISRKWPIYVLSALDK
ncbi:hypothetical protein N8T08_006011 [Aspergillus melleus]|uniref:Uncharacterized protein n=1 Tax=Aspergillus melleus TaxID=138277 RepID=A0ACC3B0R8_9EURO|nr:hypothetical protein N8T08_006011 [Aspergillus melleus]